MAFGFIPIVHIVAAVFSIIELGLTAYLASRYSNTWYGWYGYASSPSRVNFMIFNSVWSLLALAYIGLTPLYLTSAFHRLAALALNALTAVFWFAGAVALAVFVGGPYDCAADSYCGSAEAAVAFGFFLWAIFTFLAVLDALDSLRSRGHNTAAPKPSSLPGA
ncbi:marvel domain-containing protein [Hypoxylon fragiforme]|uniref:marvel domain-containing protein n=1 Tax=Hypoxylon fragiforme TaxID=63214 RepID=UPI0020C718E9|nr:marvel domain-containing protein [Hypoxylon fragiforme]KAI2604091.1 marvel domain-containing protein [Hypoxylon fragiforme]